MKKKGYDLEAMRSVDVRTVDSSELVDIKTVGINADLPVPERVYKYLKQIGNAYCFRCDDVIVKISHSGTTATINDLLRTLYATRAELTET